MIELNLREVYKGLFSRFDLETISMEILTKVIAGSEKAEDYENILKKDKFFTEIICRKASETMKHQVVSGLSHGVVVVGQQKVRNMVLGHSLNRYFDISADNRFSGIEEAEKKLVYSVKAEDHAVKCRNEYPGLAFASGFIFDFFSQWIAHLQDAQETDKELLQGFLDSNWRHSLRTAALAWSLATHERVFISHRKIIYASGLLHDIGKLGLALYKTKDYKKCIEKMRAQQELNLTDDAYEATIEREYFDLSHCEIGSGILFQTRILRDMETEVDFHHDSIVLKTRNPDAFLGTAILHIADRMAWLMDRKPQFVIEDLQEILKPHASYFPLKSSDVMQLAAQVRGKGLLTA